MQCKIVKQKKSKKLKFMELSASEENYIKAMFRMVIENGKEEISSADISAALKIKPASVSNMLSRFKEKGLVNFQRYGKATLTPLGKTFGKKILRKHRIWETYLHNELGFEWDKVHEIAEQLEHVKAPELLDKLDEILGFPQFDPHGECIPQKDGTIPVDNRITLLNGKVGGHYIVSGVRNSTDKMLHYLNKLDINIDSKVRYLSIIDFDDSLELEIDGRNIIVSKKIADNIYIDAVEE